MTRLLLLAIAGGGSMRIFQKLCPMCLMREIQWHDFGLDDRYYDQGFEMFCAQCACGAIWEHPIQSGRVDPMPAENWAIHDDPTDDYGW